MTERLRDLLREEGARVDVSPPPVNAIVAGGLRRSRVRRTRGVVSLAFSMVIVAGGLIGVNRLLADESRDPSPDVATNSPSPSPTQSPARQGSLTVSGSGVGKERFGADADNVVAAVTARLGDPDLILEPQRYFRIAGDDGWFEVADDPISPSWKYPTLSVTCWSELCLVFGGDDVDTLRLRGWELQKTPRWGESAEPNASTPDVRLAGSGIALGDSWKRLHSAYPETVGAGAEGASLVVQNTPWTGVFDGVGTWRLSGQWDFTRPNRVPPGSKVTRLSGGEGPEPGCC